MVIQLDPEDLEVAEDSSQSGSGVYNVTVEKVFNSTVIEIFQGSDKEEILEQMFAKVLLYIRQHNAPRN